jgi:threonine dehydratase
MQIKFDDISTAAKILSGNINNTPIIHAKKLGKKLDCDLFLKLECLQLTSSFKARGAYLAIRNANIKNPKKGLIAMSAGNHAQAVAYHAQKLGLPATIVMPEQAPFSKVARTKEFGAEVMLRGRTLNETTNYVDELAEQRDLILIHPYDNFDVMCGQGTVGLEFVNEVLELDYLLVPIGGGGLISGISLAAKGINPKIKIIGVETRLFPSMYNVRNGTNLTCAGDTIADGIAVKNPGELTIPIINKNVDDIVLVDEISIEKSISDLFEDERIISEGAGATGIAAIKENRKFFKNKKVGTIICGGNIDSRIFAGILNRQLSRDGKIARIRIDITDEPGMLAKIADRISKSGGNIIEIFHQRMFHDVPVKKAKIDAVIEAQNASSILEIIQSLKASGFNVLRINDSSE